MNWALHEALKIGIDADGIIFNIGIRDYRNAVYRIRKRISKQGFDIPDRMTEDDKKWRFIKNRR
ncbi:MAG: hypothetical protein U9N38_04965 [Thermodesulfobacteriota bacterium]|nr:hypothetical protein [Thermodesulfobacteriota bacterium]